ncbi:hypothetical protein [Nocardia sp. IFM 10818]
MGAASGALIGFVVLPIVGLLPGAVLGASAGMVIGWAATDPAPAAVPQKN